MASEAEWAYLAGLLDADGSIGLIYSSNRTPHIVIRLRMSDKDIIWRAQKVTGLGTIRGPYRPYKLGKKDMYTWYVGKQRDVKILLGNVYPHMGDRSQEKIEDFLEIRKAKVTES